MQKSKDWDYDDIHNQAQNLESCKKKFLETKFRKADKQLIIDFINDRKLKRSLSPARESRLYFSFRVLLPLFDKPIKQTTMEDMLGISDKVRCLTVHRKKKIKEEGIVKVVEYDTGKQISISSIQAYLIIFKMFVKWLRKRKVISWDVSEFEDELEIPTPKTKKLTEEHLKEFLKELNQLILEY
jgi:hypothetical protein